MFGRILPCWAPGRNPYPDAVAHCSDLGGRVQTPLNSGPGLLTWAILARGADSAEIAPAADRARSGGERHIGVTPARNRPLRRHHVGGRLLGPAHMATQ